MKTSFSSWALGAAVCSAFVVVSACGASSGGDSDQNESAASSEGDDTAASGATSGDDSGESGESGASGDTSEGADVPGADGDTSGNADGADTAGDEGSAGDGSGTADTADPGAMDPDPSDTTAPGDEPPMSMDDMMVDEPPPDTPPEMIVADCTSTCPVPRLCVPCGDGCSEAYVPCDAAGECGEVEWQCDQDTPAPEPDPKPVDNTCTATCPVSAICQLCADESCARPNVTCNDDGTCGAVEWVCPDGAVDPDPVDGVRCRTVDDCPQILSMCRDCPDGGLACPVMECIDSACTMTGDECPSDAAYDPCAGKVDGEYCSLCAPDDKDCIETDEIKTCLDGKCTSGVIISVQ